MTNYGDAAQVIEDEFETDGKRMIKVLRNQTDQNMHTPEEVRETIAEYLEYLYKKEAETQKIPTNKRLTARFNLTLAERIKALITGKYTSDVAPLVNAGLVFGIDWQTEDIVKLLKQK